MRCKWNGHFEEFLKCALDPKVTSDEFLAGLRTVPSERCSGIGSILKVQLNKDLASDDWTGSEPSPIHILEEEETEAKSRISDKLKIAEKWHAKCLERLAAQSQKKNRQPPTPW